MRSVLDRISGACAAQNCSRRAHRSGRQAGSAMVSACAWSQRRMRFSAIGAACARGATDDRSEEHTSELQSLMRISYAVFCLKQKKNNKKPRKYKQKKQKRYRTIR